MSIVKYRVKEVAADFGVAPKEIVEILGKYLEKPKSNTQVLTAEELNLIFDYMTQHNQIASLEQVFAVKPAQPKAEEPKAAAPQQQAGRPAQTAYRIFIMFALNYCFIEHPHYFKFYISV